MDPQSTEDGKPYGPQRYKEIAKERYLISKHIHTSYEDCANVSPTERNYLLEFIIDDLERQKQMYEKMRAEQEAKRR